jgi:hypothetical protein
MPQGAAPFVPSPSMIEHLFEFLRPLMIRRLVAVWTSIFF